jgi:hypothetical protein
MLSFPGQRHLADDRFGENLQLSVQQDCREPARVPKLGPTQRPAGDLTGGTRSCNTCARPP